MLKHCNRCNSDKNQENDFYFDKRRNNYTSPCKECRKLVVARLNHRWRKEHPERSKASGHKTRLKIKYGLTPGDVLQMLYRQGWSCCICKSKLSIDTQDKKDKPHIDHSHVDNVVRGLLCNNCNAGLGMFQDSPLLLETAKQYLLHGTPVSPKPSDSDHPLIDSTEITIN